MILVPKLNIYSGLRRWQDKTRRRLRLLAFVGPHYFWKPEDFALAGYYGYASVSAFPYGTAAAGAASQGTLLLTAASSTASDRTSPHNSQGGHRVLTSGVFEYLALGSWGNYTHTDEWIDAFGTDQSSDYEAQMPTRGAQGGVTHSGTYGSYQTISATRQWTTTNTSSGDYTDAKTLTVREIADTGNSASASMTVNLLNSPA